jgi:EAL domain-containing protein (putative c-di-GMP-specific phosphodiesterase class I)/CRP-like cAMP-binding protein
MQNRGILTPLVYFKPGELIFAAGDHGDGAYIIESGQIDIFTEAENREIVLRTLNPGDVFGEMAVIDGSDRSASARARTESHCVVVSRDQISERIEASDPVVKLLVSTLLSRIRTLTPGSNQHFLVHQSKLKPVIPPTTPTTPQPHQSVLNKMRLESEIRAALETNAFTPYYQALVDIQTQTILGFELLIRWHSKTRGFVSPDQFINLAEETSLIFPIGCWTLEKACQDLIRFQQNLNHQTSQAHLSGSRPPLFISVNISARQFQSPHFLEELIAIVSQYEIDHSQIKLEVTERLLMSGEAAIKNIQKCRDLGFHISLDDFGTGFSSLNYIGRFEVDSLKLDQSFVREMLTNERTMILVKTILSMTQELQMPSFAEGIETQEQLTLLQELGCQIGQGYLFSRPLPFEAAQQLLADDCLRRGRLRAAFFL